MNFILSIIIDLLLSFVKSYLSCIFIVYFHKFKRVGIPDVFADEYGSQDTLMERYKITVDELVSVVSQLSEGRGGATDNSQAMYAKP